MKFKKLYVLLLLALSVCLTSCGHFFDGHRASKSSAQDFLDDEEDHIETLIEYISQFDCHSFTLNFYDDHATVLYGTTSFKKEEVEIEDFSVKWAANMLYLAGGEQIYAYDGIVGIVIWTNLADFGAGIVYSNGNNRIQIEQNIDYLTKLLPLDQSGWYYYESDYNEYREKYR